MANPADSFTKEDFAHIAGLLRLAAYSGDGSALRARLSNNLNVILAALDAAAVAPDLLAALKDLYRAYVNTLETGRDRIISLGGDCDPVDVMENGDPALRLARAAIAGATGAAP